MSNCHPKSYLGGTKDLEILRLTPQDDIVGHPVRGDFKLKFITILSS